MVNRSDQLDAVRARHFAWRLARPGDPVPLDEEGMPPEPPAAAPHPARDASQLAAEEEAGRVARAKCAALADEIDRAWRDPKGAAEAAAALAKKAAPFWLHLLAVPVPQSVRLARLFVRHYEGFPRSAQKAAAQACFYLPLNHPDTTDLMVEVAEAGNETIAASITYNLEGDPDDPAPSADESVDASAPGDDAYAWYREDLDRRLIRILEEGRSFSACKIALDWLGPVQKAIPALTRALRYPHLGVRVRVLETLLGYEPSPLTADDVSFLLRDLSESKVIANSDDEDDETRYATALRTAATRVRPADGADWLEALAWDCEDLELATNELGEAWALGTLAAAYPAEATWLIDRRLRSAEAWDRHAAVEAAALLSVEEARERLLLGAADGAPHVAERARALWLEKTAQICPLEETAGVMTALLEGPPSERFLARLLVLRKGVGRAAMLEALLGEAPDREALVLVVFAQADETLGYTCRRPGLPSDREAWFKLILKRFGPPAHRGLAWLAERYPYGDHASHFNLLTKLVRERVIKKKHAGALRDAAARHLSSSLWDGEGEAVQLLSQVGAPPELLDTVWDIAVGGENDTGPHAAVDLLASWPDLRGIDSKVAREMERALETKDIGLLERAADIGRRRKTRRMLKIAQRVLAELDSRDAVDAQMTCAWALHEAGKISEAWILDKLSKPASHLFTVAARLSREPSRRVRTALVRALDSTARDGSAAAEAACALIEAKHPPPLTRIDAILARAAPPARAELLCEFVFRKGWATRYTTYLEELLTSPDPEVAYEMSRWAWLWGRSRSARAAALRALPRVVVPELRESLEEDLQV